MNTQEAIRKRIEEVLQKSNKTICNVSLAGGITPATMYSIMSGKSKKAHVISVKLFCDGVGITLGEFFNNPLFSNLIDE